MILTDFDIAHRKVKRIEEMNAQIGRGAIPPEIQVIGQPIQYFFAVKTEDDQGGICGIDAIILAMRKSPDINIDQFYVDLAILSHLPGFYVEYLSIPVLSISLEDEAGKKITGLCHFSDIDDVMETMNLKFRINGQPDLKLIIDNSENKKE